MNEIIDNLAQAVAQPEELDVALTPVEQRAILCALRAGRELACAVEEYLPESTPRCDCGCGALGKLRVEAALAAYECAAEGEDHGSK